MRENNEDDTLNALRDRSGFRHSGRRATRAPPPLPGISLKPQVLTLTRFRHPVATLAPHTAPAATLSPNTAPAPAWLCSFSRGPLSLERYI